jgi:hypothetical protein
VDDAILLPPDSYLASSLDRFKFLLDISGLGYIFESIQEY